MPSQTVPDDPATPTGVFTNAVAPSPYVNNEIAILRKWASLRWQLSRSVFGRPVPFLTAVLDLKLGDVLVTLPVAAGFLIWSALLCKDREVGDSGSPAAIVMLITFALVIRNNSVLLTLTGLPFERVLMYHKIFGAVAWIVSGLHGLAYLLEQHEDRRRRLSRNAFGEPPLSREFSGALTFYSLSALVFFSFYKIRRRFFKLFFRFHWVFFLLIVIFGVIHGAALILVGFLPWGLDLIFRYGYRSSRYAAKGGPIEASQVSIKLVTKDLVRIQFARSRIDTKASFNYHAGQYVFLCIPSIAAFEWHPFTIASAPHEPQVTIYAKVLGDWTSNLAARAKTETRLMLLVDGPYGAESIELNHYSHLVFVCGGIGITPMMSIANRVYFEHAIAKTRVQPVQKAWVLWSVRDRETLEALVPAAKHNEDELEGPVPAVAHTWLPQALLSPGYSNSKERDAFVAEIFLAKSSQDLSHAVDQRLALCLQYGKRPDIAETLRLVGQQAAKDGKRRVGVLVCGPRAMISEVVTQSQSVAKTLKSGVAFDVHQETFDF